MLIEGLKLMIMGMSTVFVFLSLMIVCIHVVSLLNRDHTESERWRHQQINQTKRVLPQQVPVPVFAAAIAAYEADRKTQK